MEQGIRELLKENYRLLMSTITEPHILGGHIGVLTPVDLERIHAEERERGASTGVFELLNRLQKRGPRAFPQLIEALRLSHPDIADKIGREAVSRNLLGYRPTPGCDRPVARGPWSPQVERSPLSSPVQPESVVTEEVHPSRPSPALIHIDIPDPNAMHGEAKSHQPNKNKGKDTLLKDISSSLKDRVVNMLSVEDAFGKNWKGIAGELGLTAEEQGQLRLCVSPMEELFNQMFHKGYCIINLIEMLRNIQRQDVIAEIITAGYYPEDLKEGVQSPTQETDDPAGKKCEMRLPIPKKDDCTIEEEKDNLGASPLSPLSPTKSTMEEEKKDVMNSPASPISPTDSTIEEKKRDAVIPAENSFSPTKTSPFSPSMEEKKRDTISPAPSPLSQTKHPLSPTRSELPFDNSMVKEMDDKKVKEGDARIVTSGLPLPTEGSVLGSDDSTKKKMDKKKESSSAGRPSEAEDAEFGSEGGAKSSLSPTQVSEFDSLDYSPKKKAHLSQEVDGEKEEQDESELFTDMTPFKEEVFFPDTIQVKAIFITCEKYQRMTKLTKLNHQIKKLSRELEDGHWEAIHTLKDDTSAKMKSELGLKLRNITKSDVCFIYLAGHTLQINGENYLLPIDVELNLSAADIIDSCLNINSLVKEMSKKALMALVIVDGGHYNEERFDCPFALSGLTSIIPTANTVIAFPCQPGYIRPQEETLLYLKALTSVIKEKRQLPLTDLFNSVRDAMKDSQSLPVEFSLSPSLLPIYLNTSEEEEEEIVIRKPEDDTPRRAMVFCDYSFELHIETIRKSAEDLESSLKQSGWQVEMFSNLKPEQIKKKLRQSLKEQQDLNVFMLYFIGYVSKDERSIGQEWDDEPPAHAQNLPIQWLVNMMSENITGPKVLIVDDPSVPVRHNLSNAMTTVPQEVLSCLPNRNRERSREEKNSFTLQFAQNLALSRHHSLKTVITTTARNWKYHRVTSELFYA